MSDVRYQPILGLHGWLFIGGIIFFLFQFFISVNQSLLRIDYALVIVQLLVGDIFGLNILVDIAETLAGANANVIGKELPELVLFHHVDRCLCESNIENEILHVF